MSALLPLCDLGAKVQFTQGGSNEFPDTGTPSVLRLGAAPPSPGQSRLYARILIQSHPAAKPCCWPTRTNVHAERRHVVYARQAGTAQRRVCTASAKPYRPLLAQICQGQ